MKILVISDSHGDIDSFLDYYKKIDGVELILFLGDYTRDAREIERVTGKKLLAVKGNNDIFDNFYKEELIFSINDVKILMTHGHRYAVNYSIDKLYYRAKEEEVDIVMFGHTHVPFAEKVDDILFLNPGSISRPRTPSREKTFISLELDQEIKYEFLKIN